MHAMPHDHHHQLHAGPSGPRRIARRRRGVRARLTGAGATLAILALLAAAFLTTPALGATQPAPFPRAATCVPATNVEAIIDDSGSMDDTDENRLRVQAMKLLIGTLDPSVSLGAVQFGSSADTVFPPKRVGSNGAAMDAALDREIESDDGSTNYNDAFSQSDSDNPAAGARIFLTDGAHNVGDYMNGHLNHKVPTYVIGFSQGVQDPEDQARLAQIASDTGGQVYRLDDSSQLQAVVNAIGLAITCEAPPVSFTDEIVPGTIKSHAVPVQGAANTVQIALTWTSPLDAFTVTDLRLVAGGRTIGPGGRGLTLKITLGQTFMLVTVYGVRAGELQFNVKATRVGSGAPSVTLTTQVASRTRHTSSAARLRAFMKRMEHMLRQLAVGRSHLTSALASAQNCSLSPHSAGRHVRSVIANRSSIRSSLARLRAPTHAAATAKARLRAAVNRSIGADRDYRRWLSGLEHKHARCPFRSSSSLSAAGRQDARSTKAKQRFLAVFNPLARAHHLHTWRADKF